MLRTFSSMKVKRLKHSHYLLFVMYVRPEPWYDHPLQRQARMGGGLQLAGTAQRQSEWGARACAVSAIAAAASSAHSAASAAATCPSRSRPSRSSCVRAACFALQTEPLQGNELQASRSMPSTQQRPHVNAGVYHHHAAAHRAVQGCPRLLSRRGRLHTLQAMQCRPCFSPCT